MERLARSKSITIAALITFLMVGIEIVQAINGKPIPSAANLSGILIIFVLPILFLIINRTLKKAPKPYLTKKQKILLVVDTILLELFITLFFAGVYTSLAGDLQDNPGLELSDGEYIFTMILLAWQLLGEEAMKISIFLFIYKDISYKQEKNKQYVIAWLISVTVFGLMHLSTYGFNFVHCILIIGLPTILYAIVWAISEKPLYMWLIHFLYDFFIFSIVFLGVQ
ncbi:MAG: hypothetical protein RR543_02195 [Erysipelotrichales bacterium]